MDIPENQKPRLCMLRKWDDFAGYGFNLHAEKGKIGQFIGKVDPNSPAAFGGLQSNDILIEVNGINVEDATHQTVVSRVKSLPDRVDLFVSSPEAYNYCRQAGLQLSSVMPGVKRCVTPDRRPTELEVLTSTEDQANVGSSMLRKSNNNGGAAASPHRDDVSNSSLESKNQSLDNQVTEAVSAPSTFKSAPSPAPATTASKAGGPDPLGNVSLAEMRARIGQNRRNQVKMSAVSFSEKYNVFQSL